MSLSVHHSGGIGVLGGLGIILVTLKVLNLITTPWLWVLAPFWVPFAIVIIVLIIVLIIFVCVTVMSVIADRR